MDQKSCRVALLISILLYAASLSQPVFTCHQPSSRGYETLLLGWAGLFVLEPRWLANLTLLPVWWYLLRFPSRPLPTRALVITALLAISVPLWISPVGCPGVDTPTAALGLALGAYLWLIAIAAAVVAALSAKSTLDGLLRADAEAANASRPD